MPTTTNFGWTTPADTDLVKDGALAIRTLGNGIDTSMVDLKGGTTGQVLSKASNTDMDFTWVADQKGSLIRITTNTFNAQTSIILSSCFSSTYDNYFMTLNVTQSGSNNIFLRLRNGSTNYTTADQRAGSYYSAWNTTVSAAGATNLDHIFQFSGTNPINSSYFFYNPYASKTTMANGCRIDSGYNQSTFYCANNTNSYDSLNLTVDAGTITGEISIYGIVRS